MNKIDITTTHNQHGFFSCVNIILNEIIRFYNINKRLPVVDFSPCFSLYKDSPDDNIYNLIFSEDKTVSEPKKKEIKVKLGIGGNYKNIIKSENDIIPFIDRYFRPSDIVTQTRYGLEEKYNITYENTAGLYFRGADKFGDGDQFVTEYDSIILPVKELLKTCPDLDTLIVQTDEATFLQYCTEKFRDVRVISFDENRMVDYNKRNHGVHHLTPVGERKNAIVDFIAMVQILSKCTRLVTTTSNVARWIINYRGGDPDDITQIFKSEVVLGSE